MKTLIVYTSKYGTVKKCVDILEENLKRGCAVRVLNLDTDAPQVPDEYDTVVIGSSVRMGKISKKVKKYINTYKDKLKNKKVAFFLCCGFPDSFDDYIDMNLPKNFAPSLGNYCFGGELKTEKLKGMDKVIIKIMRSAIKEHDFEDGNYDGMLPGILPEHISVLADKIMGR